MKTQNLIGAIMMVSLGFTACQKDELLAPANDTQAQLTLNQGATNAILGEQARKNLPLSVGLEFPVSVKDILAETERRFTFNETHQLVSFSDGVTQSSFKYDAVGRAIQMTTVDTRNLLANQKLTTFVYDGRSTVPSKIVETQNDAFPEAIPEAPMFKVTYVKYDAQMRKIMETEMPADRGPVLTRTFAYDLRGNCIRIRETIGRAVISDKSFAEFDLRQSFDANIPALALIPGQMIQKNNAAVTSEILSTGMNMKHQYNFEYDDFGYVTKVIENVSGINMVVKSIIYDATVIQPDIKVVVASANGTEK